jgi:hypothetical protein
MEFMESLPYDHVSLGQRGAHANDKMPSQDEITQLRYDNSFIAFTHN